MPSLSRSAAVVLVALLAACGDDSITDPTSAAVRLVVVSGTHEPDSALAQAPRPVVVEVRDGLGRPRPGVAVEFEAGPGSDPRRSDAPSLYLCPANYSCAIGAGNTIDAVLRATETTDAQGRATMRFRLGAVAGSATMLVAAPAFGVRDSVGYTVLPGAVAQIGAIPEDTAVYVGAAYTVVAAAYDRWGNAHQDRVTFSTARAEVAAVTADGGVTAVGVGRGGVVATAGGYSRTLGVSVPPHGQIAAWDVRHPAEFGPAAYSGLVTVELDGSAYQRLVASQGAALDGMAPDWSPNGSQILYHDGVPGGARMFVTDAGAAAPRRVTTDAVPFTLEARGRLAGDGATVYFTAVQGEPPTAQSYSLWRARPDRTVERVGPLPDGASVDWRGAISPDGSRLVYVTNRSGHPPVLRMLDVGTGQVTHLDVPGQQPAWSPAGDVIAYTAFDNRGLDAGTLTLMRPDGTPVGAVRPELYSEGVDWSGDGKWLLARRPFVPYYELVPVDGGEPLPLPFTRTFVQPALR